MNPASQTNKISTNPFKETGPGSGTRYYYKPGSKLAARFEGNKARCGNCNSMLGEFKSADGEIMCRKNDCKAINVVKK